jgi:UDP-N-acetylmuramate dehydrogenase
MLTRRFTCAYPIFRRKASISVAQTDSRVTVQENTRIANSFRVAANAAKSITLRSAEQLHAIADAALNPNYLILGDASNVLFTQNFEGLVIRNELKGLRFGSGFKGTTRVNCAAGENWANFVDIMVAKGLFGLENLSLIPGTVGASPIQNIGAYGVEMQKCFAELQAFNLTTRKTQIFTKQDCAFAYRDSTFKRSNMREWLITEVSFDLHESAKIELGYGELKTEAVKFAALRNCTQPSAADVAQAVKGIRRAKLPDPAVLGNAGSFFKNPIVETERATALRAQHPSLPSYAITNEPNKLKLSAGWLIDQAGWKGYRTGDAGVHKDHALVLVNYGSATGKEIWQLAQAIQSSVQSKFGIAIEPEPILI